MREVRPARSSARDRHRRLLRHRGRHGHGSRRGRTSRRARRPPRRDVREGRRPPSGRRAARRSPTRSTSPTRSRSTHSSKAATDALGDIEVLVSNAGLVAPGVIHDTDTERFGREVDVNLLGAHRLVRGRSCPAWSSGSAATCCSCRPTSRSAPGRSCRRTPPGSGASKGMAHALQMELEGTGVRASHRAPGADVERDGHRLGRPRTPPTCSTTGCGSGLARHPHFLKPQAIADAIVAVRLRAPRRAPRTWSRSTPEAPIEEDS